MEITIGVFEVAALTLIATLISIGIGYLNYRSGEYASLEERQRQLTQTLDDRTITYAFSGNKRVHEHSNEFIDTLEMHVKSPRVFDRQIHKERSRKEWKEKVIPWHDNPRYTRVKVKFDVEPDKFPDLYDICAFANYEPSVMSSDFNSIAPDFEGSKITLINHLSDQHFQMEVASDRATDVQRALDSFHGTIQTAIVRRGLFERGDLHQMVQRSLASDLEESIEFFEKANTRDNDGIIKGPSLDEDVLEELRHRLAELNGTQVTI
jgi:hypothetical protein